MQGDDWVIRIEQYHDWWFDNAVEFLGHLLERLGVDVVWDGGISFEPLDEDEVERLVEEIERLIEVKLKYPKESDETGVIEKKWRVYLPLTASNKRGDYKYKYLSGFLGKEPKLKKDIITLLLSDQLNGQKKKKICEICSKSTVLGLIDVTQGVYPVSNNNLESLNGVRSMKTSFKSCLLCNFLGYIEWLDRGIPFTWYMDKRGNSKTDYAYYLFPKIENIQDMHQFKKRLRDDILNEKKYSNVVPISNIKKERYLTDEYSLLLLLFEKMNENIKNLEKWDDLVCDEWAKLLIKKGELRYSYLEEIHIPQIERFKKIFEELLPYSDFVSHSFASPLKEGASKEIIQRLTKEDQYLMSKGIIMDDFKTFSKAFQIRQNCRLSTPKDALDYLIYTWRCKDGTI